MVEHQKDTNSVFLYCQHFCVLYDLSIYYMVFRNDHNGPTPIQQFIELKVSHLI